MQKILVIIGNLYIGGTEWVGRDIGFFAGLTPVEIAKQCDSKAVMWLCLPAGWALHCYWKRKYG